MMRLEDKIVALEDALAGAGIPHAFGGAIALAYCTLHPRATSDVDVNVFTGVDRVGDVFDLLPGGVRRTRLDRERVISEGQVRLFWEDTPVDLFFSYHPFHDRAEQHIRRVPFGEVTLPVLDCLSLVVFKAMFARPRDWVDIGAVSSAGAVDEAEAIDIVASLMGSEDVRILRLKDAFRTATEADEDPRPFGRP